MFVRDPDQLRALERGLRSLDCSHIEPGRLKHIASGTYNDVFSYDLPSGNPSVLRLSYYNKATILKMEELIKEKKKTGGPEYADRKSAAYKQLMVQARNVCSIDSVWIKIHFSELTNFLVKQNASPHFVYTLSSKDCKKALEIIGQMLPADQLRMRTDPKASCSTRYNNLSFQEPFDMDVTKALKKARNPQDAFRMTDDDLRSIIFQVLFSLAVLQHYVPMFRHNDLSTNNVLIKEVPMNASEYTYQLYDMRFHLVGPRFFAAMHDFDLAHADAYVMHMGGERARFSLQNRAVLKRHFHGNGAEAITPEFNPSFDAYFFLSVLLGQMSGQASAYPLTHAWLSRELQVDKYKYKYLQNVDQDFIPANLLRSNYFNALRMQPSSAPATFGLRTLELDVHSDGRPVDTNAYRRVTSTRAPPMLQGGAKSPGPLVSMDRYGRITVERPLTTHYERVILKFYDVPLETDMTGEDGEFRHDAAIAYQACESQDPRALAWLAKRLGVATANKDAKVLCADLREAVQSKWYQSDFDASDRVVYPRCPSFFTDEDILDYARSLGVPDDDLYVPGLLDSNGDRVPKSKEDLCLLAFAASQS